MKIAIPVFENGISPRFDCAPGFRLCEIEGDRITGVREIACEGSNDNERVSQLKYFGVDTLICGGLPDYLLGILTNNRIKVIPWVAGDASEALTLFLRGRLNSGMVIFPGRKRPLQERDKGSIVLAAVLNALKESQRRQGNTNAGRIMT